MFGKTVYMILRLYYHTSFLNSWSSGVSISHFLTGVCTSHAAVEDNSKLASMTGVLQWDNVCTK